MNPVANPVPLLRAINDSAAFNRWCGFQVERAAPGEVELAMPWRAELGQYSGFLHAGVVAALIDNESTLKTFAMERGKPHLRAENPRYPKMIPASELVIQGVMVALIRKRK